MKDYNIITDANRIQRHLQTALLEEEVVEVQMQDRSRTFFSHMVDELPPLEEFTEEDGSVILQEPEYQEGSYLQRRELLLIAPMEPVNGNGLIRRSQQVFFRFPIGTNSLECTSRFLAIQTVRGNPFIALEFPTSCQELTQRRYYRSKLLIENLSKVIVHLPDKEVAICSLLDIGVNGLAFENPWPPPRLSLGMHVSIQLEIPDFPSYRLSGVVRTLINCRKKKDCHAVSCRCGIQFSVEDIQVANQPERAVAAIQRGHLRILRERADEAGIELMLPL
ncbi:MAG: PilZ domain-containing protein [Proteobacteria bacterium]|nr:PilZ domain-containing protein [Pseudomonadota bacterium]MBU1649061.1 PilZ domain-containing protein [Pseudomonadota bacterium]